MQNAGCKKRVYSTEVQPSMYKKHNLVPFVLQLSTYVSWWTADIVGRKTLFIQAGFQMAMALIVVAVSLKELGEQGVWMAWYILAVICVYDM